ncbi:MAG: fatty acid--CoA ligase family protein [Sphingobium sp.]
MSFAEKLQGVMAVDPAAIALVQGERGFSWGDLAGAVEAIGGALDRAGITQGHRVGVMIRNRPSPLAAMLALFVSERLLVVLNPMIARDKLVADIGRLGLTAVIAEQGDIDAPEIAEAIGAAGCAAIALSPDLGGVAIAQQARADVLAASDPAHRKTAVEMLTSGTTGPPKRVPLSRKAFDAALDGALVYEKGRSADEAPRLRSGVSLQVGPLAHIAGVFAMLNTLLAGRRLILFDRFTVQAWRDAVVACRPRVASLVPAALRMVLDADLPREDLASLTALRSGTAPLPPETVMEFLKRYDLPVLQNYGATEFIGGISGWTLPDFRRYFLEKPRSCGRIHDGVGARIVDSETGAIRPPGEEGVLELKTAQIHGGKDWYRTTDRAIIDADNFLTICGRTDAAIIRGGFKVHPDEVVRALEAHPAVREVSVVGLPDARLGAVPGAAVILREGMVASEADILDFARAHLSAYQVPVKILVVDDLPRTPSMKPVLPDVARMIAAAMAARI